METAFRERLPFEDSVSVSLCNPSADISVSSVGCIPTQYVTEIGKSISASIEDISAKPKVDVGAILAYHWLSVSLLKEIRISDHLYVDKDVLWVTPDIIEQIMIMSNLEWTIN